jgi:hypothetical protein
MAVDMGATKVSVQSEGEEVCTDISFFLLRPQQHIFLRTHDSPTDFDQNQAVATVLEWDNRHYDTFVISPHWSSSYLRCQ